MAAGNRSRKSITLKDIANDTGYSITAVSHALHDRSDISAEANTHAGGSEPAPSGFASAAVDGDSSSFWHSNWSGGVSASNPAVITVDLGTVLEIGGFKFQQRPGTNNGIVWTYSYRILDAEGNELVSGNGSVDQVNRSGGAWHTQTLDNNLEARYIEISVLSGQGGFAAISEIRPIRVSKITLEPEVPEVPENPFVDVTENDWFHDAVLWAVGEGVTSGVSETTFDPNGELKREQFVTMLWRAAGSPAPASTENTFTDVKEGDWFFQAVLWAVEQGVTSGMGDGTFGVGQSCTRAQIVTFLYAFAGKPEVDASSCDFADVAVDAWYAPAVFWAYENGITSGMGDGRFGVELICTRAQAVTFLYAMVK